jgi:hypothetical protein
MLPRMTLPVLQALPAAVKASAWERLLSIPWTSADSSWVSIGQALGPTIVAIGVAYVAFGQWRTARAKLNLDLFERRLDIYKKAFALLRSGSAATPAGPDVHKELIELVELLPQAAFLFRKDILTFLVTLHSKSLEASIDAATRDRLAEKANQGLMLKVTANQQWFGDQAAVAREMFDSYLSFAKWK